MLDQANGCVFAYLCAPSGKLVSDVWLYNLAGGQPRADSLETFIAGGFKAQPQNPPPYASGEDDLGADAFRELDVRWSTQDAGAAIHLADRLIAIISPAVRPGCSIYARKDGPLARVLRV